MTRSPDALTEQNEVLAEHLHIMLGSKTYVDVGAQQWQFSTILYIKHPPGLPDPTQ
jgi:hypothetical protein